MRQKIKAGFIIYFLIVFFIINSQIPLMVESASQPHDKIDLSTNPDKIFNLSNLKPGEQFDSTITLQNKGDLDFYYNVAAQLEEGSERLFKKLELTISIEDKELYRGSLGDYRGIDKRQLKKATNERLTFTVSLPFGSGNEYQGIKSTVKFIFEAKEVVISPTDDFSLPITSTNYFNFLLIGSILLACGVTVMYHSCRQNLKLS
ncbi:TasA family protein [Bacillus sp. JJ1533]|uniref:TasA family protein n=1 Tax=Bacillus sp. JJ1533 TaxID=3122959 RepID=UPI002FFFAC3C